MGASKLDGLFIMTREKCNGKPLFQKQGDGNKWIRKLPDGRWAISDTKSKDLNTNESWARTPEASLYHPSDAFQW